MDLKQRNEKKMKEKEIQKFNELKKKYFWEQKRREVKMLFFALFCVFLLGIFSYISGLLIFYLNIFDELTFCGGNVCGAWGIMGAGLIGLFILTLISLIIAGLISINLNVAEQRAKQTLCKHSWRKGIGVCDKCMMNKEDFLNERKGN